MPKRLAPPSRRQRSSSFPRPKRSHAYRCSRLTRQHGGEESGLVAFDLLTLKVVSESRVTLATSVPILVFLGLSVLDLVPMYATDRRHKTDVRQQASSLNASHNKQLTLGMHRLKTENLVTSDDPHFNELHLSPARSILVMHCSRDDLRLTCETQRHGAGKPNQS